MGILQEQSVEEGVFFLALLIVSQPLMDERGTTQSLEGLVSRA